VEALFNTARDADYAAIVKDARAADGNAGRGESDANGLAARLRRRLTAVTTIDFFDASGRLAAETAVAAIEERGRAMSTVEAEHSSANTIRYDVSGGRTWVTRRGIHVDRMASAWLIRRFIDPAARFKFVSGKGYVPEPGELRFDMFEAEFTHRGDGCTFEVLLEEFEVPDPALRPIAEIVHDIDLKEEKFAREETSGIALVINGIAMNHQEDEMRLSRAAAVFDDLYEYFKRKKA
jgi:hypothetical protein